MMNILNKCFATIVDRINSHGGTVTKFGGDAVMAIWNAPQEQPDHAAEACRAVWESLQGLEDIYGEHPEIGESRFGFGINTGMAVAGNLGGRGRSQYTLIGDAVNTASRLCSSAEGGEAWIGGRTYELAGNAVETESLPPLTVKGKTELVTAFKLVGLSEAAGASPAIVLGDPGPIGPGLSR